MPQDEDPTIGTQAEPENEKNIVGVDSDQDLTDKKE